MSSKSETSPRIAPLSPPYEPAVAHRLEAMMPAGTPPIRLFRTFARNLPMTDAMSAWGAYELGRTLSLSMRDREILIDRTCARCGAEYEWGVHVMFFAERVGLTSEQVSSLTHGTGDDPCWSRREALLVRAADALHDESDIDDGLWRELADELTEAELLDLLLLCGWYHAISYVARGARVDPEPGAPRFADHESASPGFDQSSEIPTPSPSRRPTSSTRQRGRRSSVDPAPGG